MQRNLWLNTMRMVKLIRCFPPNDNFGWKTLLFHVCEILNLYLSYSNRGKSRYNHVLLVCYIRLVATSRDFRIMMKIVACSSYCYVHIEMICTLKESYFVCVCGYFCVNRLDCEDTKFILMAN